MSICRSGARWVLASTDVTLWQRVAVTVLSISLFLFGVLYRPFALVDSLVLGFSFLYHCHVPSSSKIVSFLLLPFFSRRYTEIARLVYISLEKNCYSHSSGCAILILLRPDTVSYFCTVSCPKQRREFYHLCGRIRQQKRSRKKTWSRAEELYPGSWVSWDFARLWSASQSPMANL